MFVACDCVCVRIGWAVPDERALTIVKAFSPIVEVGCGKGFWGRLLKNRGVNNAK